MIIVIDYSLVLSESARKSNPWRIVYWYRKEYVITEKEMTYKLVINWSIMFYIACEFDYAFGSFELSKKDL